MQSCGRQARGETVDQDLFLEGVPQKHVLERLSKAGGREIVSGKFSSEESSAALAVNTFGWFIERCDLFPALPAMERGAKVVCVDVEYCARFPWRGGRHPWLDAVVETSTQLIGVESKRFEPYRDKKIVSFSEAYSRDKWGPRMGPYEAMRDALSSGRERFDYLDAAQLVKHAFGLVTQGRRKGKAPVLVYLFAEPTRRGNTPLSINALAAHRAEIVRFASAVAGAQVTFHAISYREWLATWQPSSVARHAVAILERFRP
jgi:hypothetical protein